MMKYLFTLSALVVAVVVSAHGGTLVVDFDAANVTNTVQKYASTGLDTGTPFPHGNENVPANVYYAFLRNAGNARITTSGGSGAGTYGPDGTNSVLFVFGTGGVALDDYSQINGNVGGPTARILDGWLRFVVEEDGSYYASDSFDLVTAISSFSSANIRDLTWYDYDPTVAANLRTFGSVATPALTDVGYIGFVINIVQDPAESTAWAGFSEFELEQRTVYAWTGASDGNWSNTANWVGSSIPVDEYTGDADPTKDQGLSGDYTIQFSGTTMPSSNVPNIGGFTAGGSQNTPFFDLRSGGTLSVEFKSYYQDAFWVKGVTGVTNTVLTLGDGVTGGTEDVTLDVADDLYFARHANGFPAEIAIINADGTLDVAGDMYTAFHTNNSASTIFDLNGGSIVVGGNLTLRGSATRFDLSAANAQISVTGTISDPNSSGAYFDLQELGAEVTAAYGGAFVDLAAVRSAIGPTFTFRSTADQGVVARDIGGTGYRVTAVARGMIMVVR